MITAILTKIKVNRENIEKLRESLKLENIILKNRELFKGYILYKVLSFSTKIVFCIVFISTKNII